MKQRRPISLRFGAVAAILALGTVGCGSPQHHVNVETDPPGAMLFVNGVRQGVSPRKVTMSFEDYDRAYLQVVRNGSVPSGNWFTPETIPDDGKIVIRLTRN